MNDENGVAARITALCLDDDGDLRWDTYLAIAVRGGLLVDLALGGRLEQTEDSIDLDSTPTGWPPADAALGELSSLDDQSLDWWLGHSQLGPDDVATALVQDGSWEEVERRAWQRRRRFTERDPQAGLEDLALLEGIRAAQSIEEAALLSIIDASGIPELRDPAPMRPEVLEAAGRVRWVCELVADFIHTAQEASRAAGGVAGEPMWIPPVNPS